VLLPMVWYSHSFFYGIPKLFARVILGKWVFVVQIFKFDGVSCKLCISSQVCSLGSNDVNNDFVNVFNNCFQLYSEWYSIIVNSSFVQRSIFLFLECI
jgi:hypothetical protein